MNLFVSLIKSKESRHKYTITTIYYYKFMRTFLCFIKITLITLNPNPFAVLNSKNTTIIVYEIGLTFN